MRHSHPRQRYKQWLTLLFLAMLNVFIGFACYDAKGKTYSYLFGSIYTRWYNSKLAKITEEGKNVCPSASEKFCKTPCWNGAPYQEPDFLLTPNCTEYSSRQALVYVYSHFNNHEIRQLVRHKFREAVLQEDDLTVSLVFVVGSPNNMSHNEGTVMENEHKTYGDIMQIAILDFYAYLGLKALAVFKWVQQCGTKIKYLAKLDDDSLEYVDMRTIFWGFKAMQEQDTAVQNSVICLTTLHDNHVYEPQEKVHWKTDFRQYYATKYPTFCQGKWGTFLTHKVALSLYKAGRDLPVYHIDDSYIMGMLRERACVQLLHWGSVDYKFIYVLYRKIMHSIVELFAYELVLKDLDRIEQENSSVSALQQSYRRLYMWMFALFFKKD